VDQATDDRLVAALGHDRGEALAFLVRRHTPALYATARRLTDDTATAEDLLQETWLRLIRRPPRLRPDQSALPWLRRVLVHLAIDQARSRARRRTDLEGLDPGVWVADPDPPPEALAERAEERRRVREALSRLPPAYRVILVLLHGEGWSVREVGEALSLPATVVKNRALRGRRRLRALLSLDPDEEVNGHGGTPLAAQAPRRRGLQRG
jgi:RNA polymerase sigma-70 factor, ECF subfamily